MKHNVACVSASADEFSFTRIGLKQLFLNSLDLCARLLFFLSFSYISYVKFMASAASTASYFYLFIFFFTIVACLPYVSRNTDFALNN